MPISMNTAVSASPGSRSFFSFGVSPGTMNASAWYTNMGEASSRPP
jgi:hypothetical protein